METFPARARRALLQSPLGISAHIEALLASIEQLTEQIGLIDPIVVQVSRNDPRCQLAMTMPGVGPICSTSLVASIDEVGRFKQAHYLESYLGLTPGEDSSSDRQRRTGITKSGAADTRRYLVQSAWCAMRTRQTDPMVQWALNIAARSGKRKAAVALARKMAGILFAMMRDGKPYAPLRDRTEAATEKAA